MRTRILTVFVAALAMVSCTPDWASQDEADVLLILESVLGQSGGSDASGTTQLLSDVLTEGSVINDNAELTLRAMLKNPGVVNLPTGGSATDVRLRRYTIRYYRADGRSIPGVDVPHDVSGEMSGIVPAGGSTLTTSVIVVRHQAKSEPPLRNLFVSGGQRIVTMFAEITVYGETISRRTVAASGRLEIVFADFADEN